MQKFKSERKEIMRLLLCGGGTAGHINPAIAVAEEARRRDPDTQILFIGRENGKENETVAKSGFELKTLKIQGLKRSLSPSNLSRILTALEARREAERIIREFRPDVILGTGGYVCWPVISAGRKLKIPTAIHESNISPGLTTRLLASRCGRVFLGREETKQYLSKKAQTLTVGNPLREDFSKISRREARRIFGLKEGEIFILSFGGSIGAEKLNQTVLKVMDEHSAKVPLVKHIHATGQRYFDKINSRYRGAEVNGCQILPYIDNMPTALMAADIVICRCGAMTLSEISEVGVASILVPSPNVSGNHQYKNARYLSDRGAATLIEEKELTAQRLTELLVGLEIDKNGRKKQAKTLKALSTPDSAKRIVDELILQKNNSKGTVF